MSILYQNKEWLYNRYINLKKSTIQIGEECNVSITTIIDWLKKFNIPRRNNKENFALKYQNRLYRNKDWLYNQYITQKKSIIKIGDENNYGFGTIGRWLRRFNIPLRESGFQKNHNLTKGENSPRFKGDKAGRGSIHLWVRKIKNRPILCEKCGKKKYLYLSFDHSKGKCNRNPNDYQWLCGKCHSRRDINSGMSKNKEWFLSRSIIKQGTSAIHRYIKKRKEKQDYCTICNEIKKLDLACIDHFYTHNPDDYIWVCHKCHRLFDQHRAFIDEKYKESIHKMECIVNWI